MTAKAALYCRVSPTDQSLARPRQRTSEYTTDYLVSPPAIEVYSDKQTDTDRDGYRDRMHAVETGDVERVIASEVSRLSRSVRDFAATVERIVDECGVAQHVLDMDIDLNPDERDPLYARAFLTHHHTGNVKVSGPHSIIVARVSHWDCYNEPS